MKPVCVLPMHNGAPGVLQRIGSRISRMPDPARRLLVTAAAYGEQFPLPAIQAAVGGDEAGLLDALHGAIAAQLVVAGRPGWYRFQHPLSHIAVLELTSPAERRHAASALAEAILAEDPEPSGPICRTAARLLAEAGQPARAGQLYARSGMLALGNGAIEWAVADLTEAMRLQDPRVPPPAGLVRDLVRASWQAGRLDRALELVDQLGTAPARLDRRGRAAIHLELAWGCSEYGRTEQARLQLAKARSLAVGTDAGLLAIHCEAIAGGLTPGPNGAGERHTRAVAEAAERLAECAADAAERQAAAEVACRAWSTLVLALRRDRYQDSIRLRRRILALAERHDLPGWALYEREAAATERCWADGDDLPIQVLQDEAQRLGQVTLALRLQTSRWAHQVLIGPGSLAPAVAGLTACAEQARTLGAERVRQAAVGMLLVAAALRADHPALAGTLARHQIPGSGLLTERLAAARACWLTLAGRDREALSTHREMDRPRYPSLSLGLLLLLGTLAGTTSAEQVTQAMATAGRMRWTRQFLHWAAAVHAGRRGDRAEAERQAALAGQAAEIYPVARQLAARLVAPAAAADGWGTPIANLRAAEAWFHEQGVLVAARTCRDLLRSLGVPVQQRREGTAAIPARLRAAGITVREYEVGLLVCEHLGNRGIGQRLHISPRTVEKHTSALLAKLNLPDRRALIARLSGE